MEVYAGIVGREAAIAFLRWCTEQSARPLSASVITSYSIHYTKLYDLNLKLYVLIGLPTEEPADIDALLELMARLREVWVTTQKKSGRLGTLTLSVNPFIPKPFTPLQWAGMDEAKNLERKMKQIRSAIARMANRNNFV